MSIREMPDKNIAKYIEDFAKEFSLEIVNRETKAIDEGESWDWTLRKPNGHIYMSFSINYPTYHSSIIFSNKEWETIGKHPFYFSFDIYLKKIAKDEVAYAKILQACREQDWKKNWTVDFEILKQHIRSGKVQSIFDGTYWPVIHFDWDDYVEPATADQIYEDQKKRFEQPNKDGKKSTWVTFLNFFKNQK